MSANFGAGLDGVRDVGDEGAGFGTDFAALDAEAAVDAVRAVAAGAGENGDGPADGDRDAECGAALDEGVADAAHGVGTVGVAVRIAPGVISRAGDRHLELQLLVIRLDVFVGDGPVGAHAVPGVDLEVGGMEARREGGPVNGASADAFAAVVGAERERIGAAGNARVVPVELVRALFVADPVPLGIPERARLQTDNVEAGAGQTLQKYAACGTDADDHEVDLFFVAKAAHAEC